MTRNKLARKYVKWSDEENKIIRDNAGRPIEEWVHLLPRMSKDEIRLSVPYRKAVKEGLFNKTKTGERTNMRQIVFRFVKFRQPNGTTMKTSRSTITLLEKNWYKNVELLNKLRDWCLEKEGVEFGKATKTVTVNILVTEH